MEANLNLKFDSALELSEFMERYLGESQQSMQHIIVGAGTRPIVVDAEIVAQAAAAQETTSAEQNLNAPQPRTRKPRSDAGQPRGPYKTTETAGAGTPGDTGATTPGVSPTSTPLAPTPLAAPPSAAATTAPAGAGAVKLTEAHARAELKKISTEPGMGGTQAAIDYIKKFGVHQITKLPESMYEQFIRGVDQEIAAFRAKPKAPPAK